MITGKTLLDKGWPEGPILGEALRLAETLAAGGHRDDDVLATLEAVRNAPEGYAEDDPCHALAKAWRARQAPKPAPVRAVPMEAPIWGEEIIDPQAIRQLQNAMRLPVTVGGALMPDAPSAASWPSKTPWRRTWSGSTSPAG